MRLVQIYKDLLRFKYYAILYINETASNRTAFHKTPEIEFYDFIYSNVTSMEGREYIIIDTFTDDTNP